MLNDLVRMGIIQLVVQFLFFVVNPMDNPFFSTIFLQTIGFVLVGVLVYWLIVRNVFEFRSSSDGSSLGRGRGRVDGGVMEGFVVTPSDPTPTPSKPKQKLIPKPKVKVKVQPKPKPTPTPKPTREKPTRDMVEGEEDGE